MGRYALYEEIASGGMAAVHFGRLLGPAGFSRTVAIKQLHPQFAKEPDFVAMFLDEARLAARILHPNVVPTLDVVALETELLLVLDYVQGESLAKLLRAAKARNEPIPLPIVSAILCGALQGLHAAHEATNEHGEPLRLVHRDVSPQNILVGADGVARVLDFGVAKAVGRLHTTGEGQLKGKLPYMSPEQLADHVVDRRTDVYAAAIVLWEALTAQRLFAGDNEGAVVSAVLGKNVEPPSTVAPHVPKALDEVCMKGLSRDLTKRFQTAWEFALALEACVAPATTARVSEWVKGLASDVLAKRAERVARIESDSASGPLPAVELPPTPQPQSSQSQISSISVSSSPHGLQAGRGKLGYGIGAVGVGLLALAGVVAWRGAEHAPPAQRAAQLASSPPVITSVTPSASVVQEPVPSATASAITSAVARAVATAKPPHPPQDQQATHPASAAPTVHCTPPYYIDSAGHRQYKPECL